MTTEGTKRTGVWEKIGTSPGYIQKTLFSTEPAKESTKEPKPTNKKLKSREQQGKLTNTLAIVKPTTTPPTPSRKETPKKRTNQQISLPKETNSEEKTVEIHKNKKKKPDQEEPHQKDTPSVIYKSPFAGIKREWDVGTITNTPQGKPNRSFFFKEIKPWEGKYIEKHPPKHGQLKVPVAGPYSLNEIVFVITGDTVYFTRTELEDIIQRHAGVVAKGIVTKTVNYMICGTNPNQEKIERAEFYNIPRVDERWLINWLGDFKRTAENTIWSPLRVGDLWTTMYKPKRPSDIVGNKATINALITWITQWTPTLEKKALLLFGPPGIGKTTAAHLCAIQAGKFNVIERNASDARNKSSLEGLEITVTSSIGEGSLLIMDEVDGMSAGDTGGVTELGKIIKMSKIPIVCICNDRYATSLKPLIKFVEPVQFYPPAIQDIVAQMKKLCEENCMSIDVVTLAKIAEQHHRDLRLIYNFLQSLTYSNRAFFYDDADTIQVDIASMGPFDIVGRLFSFKTRPKTYKGIEDLYSIDPSIIQLFVHENYLKAARDRGKEVEFTQKSKTEQKFILANLAKAADSISLADTINAFTADWALASEVCLFGTVYPSHFAKQSTLNDIKFPVHLGNESSKRKMKGIYETLGRCVSNYSMLMTNTLDIQDSATLIESRVCNQLKEGKYQETSKLIDTFKLSKELFDNITEISMKSGRGGSYKAVPPNAKRKFTTLFKTKTTQKTEDQEESLDTMDLVFEQ